MATEFMKNAIHCIPDFNGNKDELDPFLYQVEYFSTNIPAGATEAMLLNIVLMKLKGEATPLINKVRSKTWAEMKTKLKTLFGKIVTTEELFRQIGTLEQNHNESFKEYAEKACKIKESLQALGPQEAAVMEKGLTIHFIGGLTNQNLKQTAISQTTKNFDELIQLLNNVYEKCEQLKSIEDRLQACRITKNLHDFNNESEQVELNRIQKQDLANLSDQRFSNRDNRNCNNHRFNNRNTGYFNTPFNNQRNLNNVNNVNQSHSQVDQNHNLYYDENYSTYHNWSNNNRFDNMYSGNFNHEKN